MAENASQLQPKISSAIRDTLRDTLRSSGLDIPESELEKLSSFEKSLAESLAAELQANPPVGNTLPGAVAQFGEEPTPNIVGEQALGQAPEETESGIPKAQEPSATSGAPEVTEEPSEANEEEPAGENPEGEEKEPTEEKPEGEETPAEGTEGKPEGSGPEGEQAGGAVEQTEQTEEPIKERGAFTQTVNQIRNRSELKKIEAELVQLDQGLRPLSTRLKKAEKDLRPLVNKHAVLKRRTRRLKFWELVCKIIGWIFSEIGLGIALVGYAQYLHGIRIILLREQKELNRQIIRIRAARIKPLEAELESTKKQIQSLERQRLRLENQSLIR